MKRIRFTIANLLVVVLFVAVGFAALRESSDLWDNGIFTLTLGVLLISILFAVHCTEFRRAFWIGFALCGWIYLGLSLVPSIESRLITSKALAYLDSKVPGRAVVSYIFGLSAIGPGTSIAQTRNLAITAGGTQLPTSNQGIVGIWDATTGGLLGGWSGTTENFVRIGHSLFALMVGWLGGQLSRRLCRASRQTEVSTAVESEGNSS
jgi:hypothetical protein